MKKRNLSNLRAILKLASAEDILSWSHGEIIETDTLNYRTLKPISNGLFCEKIFGPIKNYECSCGMYRGEKYKDTICGKCGVLVTKNTVRRERMGHIKLPVYLVHPWFCRSTKNIIALLLDLSIADLKYIISLDYYYVFEVGEDSSLKIGQIIDENEYKRQKIEDEFFYAETGAKALYLLLSKLNLEEKIKENEKLEDDSNSETVKTKKKQIIDICRKFIDAKVEPKSMILEHIPVLPPDLRPMVEVEPGYIFLSDLNALYKMIIYRKSRLETWDNTTVDLIIKTEIRLLQNAVDLLFGTTGEQIAKNPKKSIKESLQGKDGLFRKQLLGKRVDYSGRSVIVVAPNIKLDECLIPREMALEIYKPIIVSILKKYGLVTLSSEGRSIIDDVLNNNKNNYDNDDDQFTKNVAKVYNALDQAILQYPIAYLNRAPTLHRMGFMSFFVSLWDEKAIGLHPLVCPVFNADYDGDQMAFHVPFTEESIGEAYRLMLPRENLVSPAHGGMVISSFRHVTLGLFKMTVSKPVNDKKYYFDLQDIKRDLHNNLLDLREEIFFVHDELENTTAGRLLLWDILPKIFKFKEINEVINAKKIQSIIQKVYDECSKDIIVELLDNLKDMGFKYAYKFGVSVGIMDLQNLNYAMNNQFDIINKKQNAIDQQYDYLNNYYDGFMTQDDLKNNSLDLWTSLENEYNNKLKSIISNYIDNPLISLMESGAKGSLRQMTHTLFMKGNVVDVNGKVEHIAIWKSHQEGISPTQIFSLSAGVRKGLSDVAVKTAECGYFTRKIVDMVHSGIINDEDCGTDKYINALNVFKEGKLIISAYDKSWGRCLGKDLQVDKEIWKKNTLLSKEKILQLKEYDITEIPLRSPMLCESLLGICQKCYGNDLSGYKNLVNIGEAVGLVAAQSIGEPATQLTMRSFHHGGTARFGENINSMNASFKGIATFKNVILLKNKNISHYGEVVIKNDKNLTIACLAIPYGCELHIKDNVSVEEDTLIASWENLQPIFAEKEGSIIFKNFILGSNVKEYYDYKSESYKMVVLKNKNIPYIKIIDTYYCLNEGTKIEVEENQSVKIGDVIAYNTKHTEMVDVVEGLQKVIEITENRIHEKQAILSPISGTVQIYEDKKNKLYVAIDDGEQLVNLSVNNYILKVQQGQYIEKGTKLTNGIMTLQDILDYMGEEALIHHFTKELQSIYHNQGINVNDKHFEVLLNYMCKRFIVEDSGSSHIPVNTIIHAQEKIDLEESYPDIKYKKIVSGITHMASDSGSPLSNISFQETANSLISAGIKKSVDFLNGTKPSLIVGLLLPLGTGCAYYNLKNNNDLPANFELNKYVQALLLGYYMKTRDDANLLNTIPLINDNFFKQIYYECIQFLRGENIIIDTNEETKELVLPDLNKRQSQINAKIKEYKVTKV